MTRLAQRTLSCPHCGLALTIDDSQGSLTISYDPVEWRRLCQYPDLASPALCLLEGGDSSGDSGSRPDSDDRSTRRGHARNRE